MMDARILDTDVCSLASIATRKNPAIPSRTRLSPSSVSPPTLDTFSLDLRDTRLFISYRNSVYRPGPATGHPPKYRPFAGRTPLWQGIPLIYSLKARMSGPTRE